MKKVTLLLACLMMGILSGYAQEAKVSFDTTTHDFGQIDENGGKVSHDFLVTNTGSNPITIVKVKASCGCTTPNWTRTPIEPGASGTVTATYNPKGRPGKFNKSITVDLSEGNSVRLSIKGDVLKEEPKPEVAYPIVVGNLRIKATELTFGQVSVGKDKALSFDVYNNSSSAITPKVAGLPDYITVTVTSIPANSKGKVEFKVNGKNIKKYGVYTGSLSLDGVKNALTYRLTALEDFSSMTKEERSQAARMNLSAPVITLNKEKDSAIVKVSNSGKSDLQVKSIHSNDGNLELSKKEFKVKPGEIYELVVKYPAKKITGNVSTSFTLFSNDPASPSREVRVTVKN